MRNTIIVDAIRIPSKQKLHLWPHILALSWAHMRAPNQNSYTESNSYTSIHITCFRMS